VFEQVAQAIDAAPTEADKPVVWICAHQKKGGNGSLEDVSGSTQRTGQADTVIFVKGERDGGRIVSSTVSFPKLREDADGDVGPVTFAVVNDGQGGRRLVVNDAKPDDDRPLEARILSALEMGPKTKNALARCLNKNKAAVDDAISTLFAERRITTTDITVNSRAFKAFAIRQGARNEHGTRGTSGRAANDQRTPANEAV
jgi:hypothetical protein